MTSDSGETPLPGAPRPWQRGRPLWVAGIVAVVALVVAAGVAGWMSHRRESAKDVANARAGDCVGSDVNREPPYRVMPCAADGAEFTVLKMLPRDTGGRECPLVPGAALWFTVGERSACLGKKGVDPATAVNVAQEGDCLAMEDRSEPLRLNCADPRATMVVLRRLHDVSRFGSPCEGVPGTTRSHGWNWIAKNPVIRYDATIDVMLCLGASEQAKAAAAASASAAAAATDPCRFVTLQEMSAAVSRAAGRTFTAVSATRDQYECDYAFGKSNEISTVFRRSTDFRPGTGDETLTVDGLRAYYGPGEGTRALSVFLPNGNFTVVAYRMQGISESAAKKIGIEVFRAARPRLS